MSWFSQVIWLIIGAGIIAVVLIKVFQSIPRWVLILTTVVAVAIVLGVKFH